MTDFYDFYGGPCDGCEAWFGDNPPKTRTVKDRDCVHHYKLSEDKTCYEYVKTVMIA